MTRRDVGPRGRVEAGLGERVADPRPQLVARVDEAKGQLAAGTNGRMEHLGGRDHALGGQALEGRGVVDGVDGALGPRGAKVVLYDVNGAWAIQARAGELREALVDDASDRGMPDGLV